MIDTSFLTQDPGYRVGQEVDGKICTGSRIFTIDDVCVIAYKWKKVYPRASNSEKARRIRQMKWVRDKRPER